MTLNLEHTTKANQHDVNSPTITPPMGAGVEGRIGEGPSTERLNVGSHAYKAREPWGALYEHNGERLTLRQWATRVGVKAGTLKQRLHRGYTLARALSEGTTDRRECLRRATMARLAKRGDDRMGAV